MIGNREVNKICDFLEVPHQIVSSDVKKQNKRPLTELIENYQDLKSRFYNTPWSSFFSD